MIKLVGEHSKRELIITLSIWGLLLAGALTALLLLRNNAVDVINHIYYVNVSRGSKATVLYAEAQKNARAVMARFNQLNSKSDQKVPIPATDAQLQRALDLYRQAFAIDPQPEFAPSRTTHYELLAQLYEAMGDNAGQLVAHGRALLSVGDQKDALDYLSRAHAANPAAAEPLVVLAKVKLTDGDIAAATQAIDEVYTSSTVTPEARFVRAQIQAQKGDVQSASQELTQALQESPENLDYRTRLGEYLNSIGRTPDAAKTMQDGLSHGGWMDPAYLHTYSNYLLKSNDLAEAIRVLEQADRLAPYSGDVQFSLAQAYNQAGKKRQAASALRRAVEVKPELQDRILE